MRCNMLYKIQCSLRSKVSTIQAVVNHVQYLYDTIDSGLNVFSLFLGFQKANVSLKTAILRNTRDITELVGIILVK